MPLTWNNQIKLIISDVDDTIAPSHDLVRPKMAELLNNLLKSGAVLFMISGSEERYVFDRVIKYIQPNLRQRILVGHCNGVELWGYDEQGELISPSFYNLYDERLNHDQRLRLREVAGQITSEFHFRTHSRMPRGQFVSKTGGDPLSVMYEDKGTSISFGLHNATDLNEEQISLLKIDVPQTLGKHDLRIPFVKRANELFEQFDVPITAILAGAATVDMVVKDVSKTTAVQFVMHNAGILSKFDIDPAELLSRPEMIEIWGDRFSKSHGTDWLMSVGVDPRVRSIDFRDEDPKEFPSECNITLWDGAGCLDEGLINYLRTRA